jgi:hypothetical protein
MSALSSSSLSCNCLCGEEFRLSGENRGGGSNSIGSGEEDGSLAETLALGILKWSMDNATDNDGDDRFVYF